MGVPARHVLAQGPMLMTLLRTAASVAAKRALKDYAPKEERAEGPIRARLPPRPAGLVRDYIRHVGGDSSWYRGVVPGHLFPQWGMPLLARTLTGLPYDLTRVLNGGVTFEFLAPIPADEPLEVEARLVSIDDDGRRAILRQECVTGTRSSPRALVATTSAIVPLAKSTEKKERPRVVPSEGGDLRELGRWRLRTSAGVDFAKLTGDFNPIHLFAPYARAAGQKSVILHGYATLARAIETLNRALFAQDPRRLTRIEVRFVRPLVLPNEVGVYCDGNRLFVGDAPFGPAYLTGTFDSSSTTNGKAREAHRGES
ncbi:MAG: hypothetical protein HY791_02595 [Deltaproteobacteria bacterium]|nr:hypothetical protein [Deltaproteobacteria bacterium]